MAQLVWFLPSPVQIPSQLLNCEMCFAGTYSMWSCPGVVLHGGRHVCLCALLSALVRNFQAGLSAVTPLKPDPMCRSAVRQGDLLYPEESLLRSHRVWGSHLCHWPFAATEPAPGNAVLWGSCGLHPSWEAFGWWVSGDGMQNSTGALGAYVVIRAQPERGGWEGFQ